MRTTAPAPAPAADGAAETSPEPALVSTAPAPEAEHGLKLSAAEARLPVELDVAVPVREFRVRHLLGLEAGTVIASQWSGGTDVPLAAGAVQLAWSEFEVIGNQIAVRITRLP
jgi:flagellar motor switch protein FliN/FliY